MTRAITQQLYAGLQAASPARLAYTRQAYHMLPALQKPRILDLGCGQGGPTLELARLSSGEVIGVDIDQDALEQLVAQSEEAGLTARIRVVNCSLSELDFPLESFDIIWSEGSILVVGFETGLRYWRQFICPNRFLVVHEATWLRPDPPKGIVDYWQERLPGIRTAQENIEAMSRQGYRLVGHFLLPEDFWWRDHYQPLQARIVTLRQRYADDEQALAILEEKQRDVDLYRAHAQWYGSAFYLMQKA